MSRETAKGSTVPEPLVITISHRLGRDEAKRRLEDGLGHIRGQLAAFVSSLDYTWTGYRLDFSVTAMRQSINGRIEYRGRHCPRRNPPAAATARAREQDNGPRSRRGRAAPRQVNATIMRQA
jgi:hypothetical protein